MKLISINIECDRHTQRVLSFLKKEEASVVCVQEILEDQFEMYKKELHLDGVFQACEYFTAPHYKELIGKKMGVAIFSKNIISSGSVFYEGKEENALKPFSEYISDENLQKNKAFVWIEIKNNDGILYKFITTHLPVTKEGEVTSYQIMVINSMLRKLNDFGEFILCGDFNAPRGRESFSLISEKYKDNIPLEYKTSIDQNLHKTKGIQFVVDGLFTTPSYQASDVRLQDGVSDHMAIIADLNKVRNY